MTSLACAASFQTTRHGPLGVVESLHPLRRALQKLGLMCEIGWNRTDPYLHAFENFGENSRGRRSANSHFAATGHGPPIIKRVRI